MLRVVTENDESISDISNPTEQQCDSNLYRIAKSNPSSNSKQRVGVYDLKVGESTRENINISHIM